MIINNKTISKLNSIERYTVNHFLKELIEDDYMKRIRREQRLSTILDKERYQLSLNELNSLGEIYFINSIDTDSYRCMFKLKDTMEQMMKEYCWKEMEQIMIIDEMNKIK